MHRRLPAIIEEREPAPEPVAHAAMLAAGPGSHSTDGSHHYGPHPWSRTYSQILQALDANEDRVINMRGQRLGPFPDITLCQLFRGRLSNPACVVQFMDLADTGIRGDVDFAECFRGNTSITHLNLDSNFIDDVGLLNLASALRDTCVVYAHARSNLVSVGVDAILRFHDVLRTNMLPTVAITLTAYARPPHPRLYVEATDMAGDCWDIRYADPHMCLQAFAEASAERLSQRYAGCKIVFVTALACVIPSTLVTRMRGMPVSALCLAAVHR